MGLDDRASWAGANASVKGSIQARFSGTTEKPASKATHQNHKKAVPIRGGAGDGGGEFKPKNRNFAPRADCRQPSVVLRAHPAQKWIYLLSALAIIFSAYREVARAGWLLDWEEAVPFPSSGSVTVNREIDRRTATSRLRVITAGANAVVQLYPASKGVHIISFYYLQQPRGSPSRR